MSLFLFGNELIFQDMLNINTNNYVESWHNQLKTGYLRNSRKKRIDVLVHIPLRKVLPDFKLKIGRVCLGLDKRRLSNAERKQLEKAMELDHDLAKSMINRIIDSEGEDYMFKLFIVKSFSQEERDYFVSLNEASTVSRCSCDFMVTNKLVCKHMFLVHKIFGYCMNFDTRASGQNVNVVPSLALLENQATSSTSVPEVRQDPIESKVRVLTQMLDSAKATLKRFRDFSNEKFEVMDALEINLKSFKRIFDIDENSWSKRQRR